MSYAGDLSPQQAFDLLKERPDAVLVDVRTQAEWAQIGTPDLSELGREAVFLEWNTAYGPNADFVPSLQAEVTDDVPVIFLCRSGVRSVAAANAATAAGFKEAYNVLEGFEGNPGPTGARDVEGWKARGLPWTRS
ncbi:rhodanese-like domain-containing protein [Spongisporangium articulatum]|uniref:Rhodanese-like domain-containing protein n=1 Tax=Spongisporangium articulatum TaxID=3362603 RepID=A0ABW8ALP2_9ACTN